MSDTIICRVVNSTVDDLRQWCSHNLTGKFRVRAEYDYERRLRKPDSPEPVFVYMVLDNDRLRLRDAYDIANTSWSIIDMESL